jgi:hypothetical protein
MESGEWQTAMATADRRNPGKLFMERNTHFIHILALINKTTNCF